MDVSDITEPRRGGFFGIIITEFITVALIILTLSVCKYFFKSTFKEVENWYKVNICSETSVEEVLETAVGNAYEV